jgi:predicted outer membrane repeat protein
MIPRWTPKLPLLLPALAWVAFCLPAGPSAPAAAALIHVPADRPTIQAGINAALDGDTVLVADGIYTGDENRDIDFLGKAITVRSANGPENCVVDCQGGPGSAHRGFLFHSSEGDDAVLHGMTILNGYVDLFSIEAPYGGGICILGASPRIEANALQHNGNWYYEYNGGGIYCSSSAARILGNRFEGNAVLYGGGIYAADSDLLIEGNTFAGNSASYGGGIYCSGGSIRIRNNAFTGNVGEDGVGIYCLGVGATIDGNVLSAQIAAGSGFGSGLFLRDSPAVVMDNVIDGNQTEGRGGGVGVVGAGALLFSNRITHNRATTSGGGIQCLNATCTIVNCTVADNEVWDDPNEEFQGGGLASWNSTVAITNSIFWDNHNSAAEADEIHVVEAGGEPAVTWSDVAGGYAGEGNLDLDPAFVAGPLGDYYLSETAAGQTADSPGIDAGGAPAGDMCAELPEGTVCLDQRTTRSDHQGMDTGQVNMGFHADPAHYSTVDASLTCSPGSGTVPFSTQFSVLLESRFSGQTRRVAARIDVRLAGGVDILGWKSGYTNLAPGETYATSWNQAIPAAGAAIGVNLFELSGLDVTPFPYNQTPYPPSGDEITDVCTLIGLQP